MNSIEEFLKTISLEHLLSKFIDNKIEFYQLQQLSESDLSSIGIDALGDRKKIIEHIQNIKAKAVDIEFEKQIEANAKILSSLVKYSFRIFVIFSVILSISWCYSEGMRGQYIEGVWVKSWHYDRGIQSFIIGFLVPVLAWIAGFIYLFPSYNAFKNVHQYRWGILLANVFFGYTVVIWFICLFVSFSLVSDKETAALVYLGKK